MLSSDRFRDLLAPLVGARDLLRIEGSTVADLSPEADSPLALAFLLILLGAERAYVVLDTPLTDARAVRDLATVAHWLVYEPHRLIDGPPPDVRAVRARLEAFDLEAFAAGRLEGDREHRLIVRSGAPGQWPLPEASVDLVVSFSLLEHLDGVPDALAALAKAMRPGGLGVHLVDLVDHRFYAGLVATPRAFLAEAEGAAYVHGSNRLRAGQWAEAFGAHGFTVERVERWTQSPTLGAAERAGFVAPFRDLPDDELTPTGARLFVRRGGAPPRVRASVSERQATVAAAHGALDADVAARIYDGLSGVARGDRAPDYVSLDEATPLDGDPLVTVVAFYLPQYHPIPENDAWWGRGFTEWTNVSKAVPQFAGHDQPRLPGELGFYDLRVPDVMRRQVALARRFGVSAFCFYHYWFGGRRLLERPLQQLLADPSIDISFCLCWANENWTRRWTGDEAEILMAQDHDAERDAAFIDDALAALRDPRYLTIDGRPLLLVYRPALMPDPAGTAARWREACRRAELPEPYLAATDAFDGVDPRAIGFDALVEFPPNTAGRPLPTAITESRALVRGDYGGRVFRYADMRRWRMERETPEFPLFRAACPGFDNEARRPGAGSTYIGQTPEGYGRWLGASSRHALAAPGRSQRLVFVNAWNEWAEAAYLEPDRRHGYAYLDATAQALNGLRADWTLLLVSHDACRGGAQSVLLEQLAWLRRHTSIRCAVLCLAGGEWLDRFRALADTAVLPDLETAAEAACSTTFDLLLDLCGGPPAAVLANTAVASTAFDRLRPLGAPIVTQLHELSVSLARYAPGALADIARASAHIVACAEPVRALVLRDADVSPAAVTTVPATVAARAELVAADAAQREARRLALGLPAAGPIVVGSGLGMPFRKGADLFLDVARRVRDRGRGDVTFVWVGGFPDDETDATLGRWADHLARARDEGLPVTFTGVVDDIAPYLQAADLFLLPSREDPFPLVVFEAAACELPTVCFAGAGGMPAFVGDDAGEAVPSLDVPAMAAAVIAWLDAPDRRREAGRIARARWRSYYTPDAVTPRLLSVLRRAADRRPAVSVIVPNYNHARYLPARLDSILAQSFRDVEILILDDASTDESLDVIAAYRDRADVRVIVNETNSGSPFAQWLKGLDESRGDLVWIAESDDACAPEFLDTLVGLLRDPFVRVAYANSSVWNERGEVTGDYASMPYLTDLSPTKWREPYCVPAGREVNDGFGVKNTFLTASAVVFRRFPIDEALRQTLRGMRVAGDWLFFAAAMRGGDVAYTPRALNHHRRHGESVVGKLLRERRTGEFWREFAEAQRAVLEIGPLEAGFAARWDAYLRSQWDAFYPGRPFEELATEYPLDDMRRRIVAATGAAPR